MSDHSKSVLDAEERIREAREVIRAAAAQGDPMASMLLLKLALDTTRELDGLTDTSQGLAALKFAAVFSEEIPATAKNPIYLGHRRPKPDDFIPMSSGQRLFDAVTALLPFKLAASTGTPKKDDLLGQYVQFFVRGVHVSAIPGSDKIIQRLQGKRGDASAWADEFVEWYRTHHRAEVEDADGAFHALASQRLKVKRRSQLDNPKGHSVDGDNLWVQFKQVVTERLRSEIPKGSKSTRGFA